MVTMEVMKAITHNNLQEEYECTCNNSSVRQTHMEQNIGFGFEDAPSTVENCGKKNLPPPSVDVGLCCTK